MARKKLQSKASAIDPTKVATSQASSSSTNVPNSTSQTLSTNIPNVTSKSSSKASSFGTSETSEGTSKTSSSTITTGGDSESIAKAYSVAPPETSEGTSKTSSTTTTSDNTESTAKASSVALPETSHAKSKTSSTSTTGDNAEPTAEASSATLHQNTDNILVKSKKKLTLSISRSSDTKKPRHQSKKNMKNATRIFEEKIKNGTCGYCNKNLSDVDVNIGTKYTSKCICCRKTLVIKKKCAAKIYFGTTNPTNDEMASFTTLTFKNGKNQLHCYHCNELHCFYCKNKKHRNNNGTSIQKSCDGCGKIWCFILPIKTTGSPKNIKPCQKENRGNALCLNCRAKDVLRKKRKKHFPGSDKKKSAKLDDGNVGDLLSAGTENTNIIDDRYRDINMDTSADISNDNNESVTNNEDVSLTGGLIIDGFNDIPIEGLDLLTLGGINVSHQQTGDNLEHGQHTGGILDLSPEPKNNGNKLGTITGGDKDEIDEEQLVPGNLEVLPNSKNDGTKLLDTNTDGNKDETDDDVDNLNDNMEDDEEDRIFFNNKKAKFILNRIELTNEHKEKVLEVFNEVFIKDGKPFASSLNDIKKKFLSRFQYKKNLHNLFNIKLTKNQNSIDISGDCDDGYFDIDFGTIMSLFDDAIIEDKLVYFMMEIFNLYVLSVTKESDMPEVYFIHSLNTELFKIEERNEYATLRKHLKNLQRNKDDLLDDDSLEEFKSWMENHEMGDIKHIIERGFRLKKPPNQFVCPFRTKKLHWINFLADLRLPIISIAYLFCIDFSKGKERDDEKKFAAVWFSKFFALYLKKYNGEEYDDGDFDCKDIVAYLNSTEEVDNLKTSMINIEMYKYGLDDSTEYNSGIFVLLDCFKQIKDDDDNDDSENLPDYDEATAESFKIKIASFVLEIYDVLVDKDVNLMKNHTEMDEKLANDWRYVTMFQKLHYLFYNNKLKLDIDKGNHANHYMLKYKDNFKRFESFFYTKCPNDDIDKFEKISSLRDDDDLPDLPQISLETLLSGRRIFKDMSGSRVYYVAYDTTPFDLSPNDFNTTEYWTPLSLKNTIVDLYLSKYNMVSNDTGKNIASIGIKRRTIEYYMRRYPTYLMFDKTPNDGVFEIAAAITMEYDSHLYAEGNICLIIHLLGIEERYEDRNYYLETLVYKALQSKNLTSNDLLIVTRVGNDMQYYFDDDINLYVPWRTFTDNNFVWKNDGYIDNLVDAGSQTIFGNMAKLSEKMKKSLVKDQEVRFGCIHNMSKVYLRKTDKTNDKFDIYSHVFGWQSALPFELPTASKAVMTEATNRINVPIKLVGGGSRTKNTKNDLQEGATIKEVEKKFLQNYYKQNGSNCTWLTAAMMINITNKTQAQAMLNEFNTSKDTIEFFEYMNLKKLTTYQREYESNDYLVPPLGTYLASHYRHQLCKVSLPKGTSGYLEFILRQKIGYYICLLLTDSGQRSHVIGIDCFKQEIYDCMETHTLCLNRDNLNYCAGKILGGIKDITTCLRFKASPSSLSKAEKKKNKKKRTDINDKEEDMISKK